MGPNSRDKFVVTVDTTQVCGYAPHVMLHTLYKNLWPPKGAI